MSKEGLDMKSDITSQTADRSNVLLNEFARTNVKVGTVKYGTQTQRLLRSTRDR